MSRNGFENECEYGFVNEWTNENEFENRNETMNVNKYENMKVQMLQDVEKGKI